MTHDCLINYIYNIQSIWYRYDIMHVYAKLCKNITLWLFNIAMENGPFIDGLPIKNGDFPWLC